MITPASDHSIGNSELGSFLILFSVALIFLFTGHYQQEHDGGHGLYLPFNTLSWIPVMGGIGFGLWLIASSEKLRYSRLSMHLLLACILLTAPIFYPAAAVAESLLRIVGLWLGFLFFVSLQQQLKENQIQLLMFVIVAGVWIEGARYWWNMLTEFQQTGEFLSSGDVQLHGVFGQRNVMSSFVATGLVISMYLLTKVDQMQRQKLILVYLLLSPLFLAHILQSMASRAGWYGFLIGIALCTPWVVVKGKKLLLGLWALMFWLGTSVSLLLANSGGWSLPSKNILSFAGPRTYTFPQTMEMISDSPLFGVGLGNFESAYINYSALKFREGGFDRPGLPETFHPHNEFLLWWAEGGIVPVVGLLLAAWAVWSLVIRFPLPERLALIGLFFPIVLHSQVEFPFYASVLHFVIFIILIAYVDNRASEFRFASLKTAFPIKVAAVALPLLGSLFLATTLYSGLLLSRFNANQVSMAALDNMNNTIVWRDRLNYTVRLNYLLRGLMTGNTEYIELYTAWVPDLIARRPRPIFVEYQILGEQALGNTEKANSIKDQFRYLFPNNDFTLAAID